jgi:GH15 family glucan-1,4-alpha-glucosidase
VHDVSAPGLDYGLIGNGRIAALIDGNARIVWWCFPRLDGNPVFSRLLSGDEDKGYTDVVLQDQVRAESSYERNTAIISTVLTDAHGGSVRITDFAPRFTLYGRIFHPAQIFRRIEPLSGLPRIRIRVRPTFQYGVPATARTLGSSHIRFAGGTDVVRVTTDGPLSYLAEETPFALIKPITLVFGPDEPFESGVETTGRHFEHETRQWWLKWVRALAVPYEWQSAVIRSAITLKLCTFEDTGAIVAALTTSIPEAAGSGRTWDYRFCWLRDAYFVVQALNHLGNTSSMEAYLDYLTNAIQKSGPLRPVYGIVPSQHLDEWTAKDLAGFEGHGPVRVGNAAAEQHQHDTYGSIILASQQMFVDERLERMGDVSLFRRLEQHGELAWRLALQPDAGIWEYRGRWRVHTHSAAMCWVACDRLSSIANALGLPSEAETWSERARALREEILKQAWHPKRGAFTAAFGSTELDASSLLLAEIGLVAPSDPRFISTCEVIERELTRSGHIMRYTANDDFGTPESAFVICRFWLADALAAIGRTAEARDHFVDLLRYRNTFGLMSEDIDPVTGRLWGNLPQTYSMAGIVITAKRLSKGWEQAWSHGSS